MNLDLVVQERTPKSAENPTLFASILEHKKINIIAIPKEKFLLRISRYIPMDSSDGEIIPGKQIIHYAKCIIL